MSYHHLDPDDLDLLRAEPSECRSISDAAGLGVLGLRVYRADPGEMLPLAYHYHDEQEEAFYVVAGTLHVETPEGEFAVDAGEVFAVEPGNPHRAFNPGDADETVEVVAVGAPSVDDVHAYEEA
jgi:uncharacterized cupin superfamily protein